MIMRSTGVGCVPIVEDGEPAGIVTDRDLVVRGLADGRDPDRTAVQDIMSTELVTVSDEQLLDDAITTMIHHNVNRVLVTDRGGNLVGILSCSDAAVFCSSPREISALMTRLSERDRHGAQRVRELRI